MRFSAWISILGVTGAACALPACGGGETAGTGGAGGTGNASSSSTTGTSSSASSSTSASSGGGASASSSTSTSTSTSTSVSASASGSSSASASSAASSSSSGGGANLINGCDPMTAEDKTGQASVTISFGALSGLKYVPACINISPGTQVIFSGNFSIHPLVGGTFKDGVKMPDANSPIKATSTGVTALFTFADTGTFPYYCDLHAATAGMMGAIFVK